MDQIELLIQQALCAYLESPPLSGAPPIGMPFVKYTPTPDVAYVEARPVMRADPQHDGLSFGASTILRGVFQVDAVVPNGAGEEPGLRLAALVRDRFAIGTDLVAGTKRLQIDRHPIIAAAVKDAPWIRFPVSIRYLVIN